MDDIQIINATLPTSAPVLKKPAYLIQLQKPSINFLSFDKPELLTDFVSAKGFFTNAKVIDGNSKVLDAEYVKIMSSIIRENIVEKMFPSHRIIDIQNLAYKAKEIK